MTRIVIKKLIWEEWNTEHIKKHKVSQSEAEEVSKNMLAHQKVKQGRYAVIGRIGSRILTLIVNRIGTGIYYPVTARDAAKKERRKVYEKEKTKIS